MIFLAWIRIRLVFAWIRICIKFRPGSGSVTNFVQLLDPGPHQHDTDSQHWSKYIRCTQVHPRLPHAQRHGQVPRDQRENLRGQLQPGRGHRPHLTGPCFFEIKSATLKLAGKKVALITSILFWHLRIICRIKDKVNRLQYLESWIKMKTFWRVQCNWFIV